MIKQLINKMEAEMFGDFIKNKTNYLFLYKSLLGAFYGVDPWINEDKVEFILKDVSQRERVLAKFFLLCESIEREKLSFVIGEKNTQFLIDCGYAYIDDDNKVIPDNYVLIPIENKLFVVNPPYKKFRNGKKVPDLYVGADSLKLINFFKGEKRESLLDLCSGSGIIGISLSDYVDKIDFVEIREDVIDVLKFNLLINRISEERVEVKKSDLYDKLGNKKYDYIVTNPPFIPTPKDNLLPICGDGGIDGMDIIRRILKDLTKYLKPDGRFYMVLEAIGDENKPFVVDLFKEKDIKGTVNVSLFNRQLIEEQARVSAIISKDMFDNLESVKELYDLWMNSFESFKATYVYPTLIEYILSDAVELNVYKNYEEMNRALSYKAKEEIEIEQLQKTMYRVITKSGSFIVDNEMLNFIGTGEVKFLNDLIKIDSSKYFEYLKNIRYLKDKGIIDIV
ncbi:MAG: methyltransferase [Clostridium botulinum]|uniref:methyltransferase n=1 Tax=Enterococcus faecalis TaxID=1351 RepID=UPI0029083C7D|nr:methyltransferase [Clostridium botulinum]